MSEGGAPEAGLVMVYFDGACEPPHRGTAAWAFVIEGEGLDHQEFGRAADPGSEEATNNVAEYQGAIHALAYLQEHGYAGRVRLRGDSQLVIRQLEGTYRVKERHLLPLHARLKRLTEGFASVLPEWVPREQNALADELSKRGVSAIQRGLA